MSDDAKPFVVRLVAHEDMRGYLFEIWRADVPDLPAVRQVYCSATRPGVVKGWHRHQKQWDMVTCVQGVVKVVTWRDSTTEGEWWILSPRNLLAVVIPPGYWHGWKNIGEGDALMVNCVSECYDPENPDDERMDPYEINRGVWVTRDG